MRSVHLQNAPRHILRCLPQTLREVISEKDLLYAEELRLRAGAPMMLVRGGQSAVLQASTVTPQEIEQTVMRICNHSVYAAMEQIKNGFLLLPGGVRVGLSGCVLSCAGEIENIKEFTGLNFRVPREITGCADKLLSHILQNGQVKNTLLISPPGCGKTTILRDLVRSISARGLKVCVIDERDEICGMHSGLPAFDIGVNTDVLRLCPKEAGVSLAIRTLSPQVIVTDELWGDVQFAAMSAAAACGCSVVSTMHGAGRQMLTQDTPFEVYVTLGRKNGPGTLKEVYTRA